MHFTSEAEAAEARALGIPMREAIIPLGIEPAPAAGVRGATPSCNTSDGLQLLFLSRLDPKKNLEGLLDAFASLSAERPRLRLMVAGGGAPNYEESLKARARNLGISTRVCWLGHIEGPAKAAAFAGSDVFVLPSFSENFGVAVAEALAAGLPCIVGHGVAIATDVVQANAGVATGTDPKSIANALRRVMANKEAIATMSGNARRLAQERFSMEAMGVRLKQLYTEILNP